MQIWAKLSKAKAKIAFPPLHPANPILRRDAFDNRDYIFELKHDGFRALATWTTRPRHTFPGVLSFGTFREHNGRVLGGAYASKFGLSRAEPSSQTVDRRRGPKDFGNATSIVASIVDWTEWPVLKTR
jgi:hypothetical protein